MRPPNDLPDAQIGSSGEPASAARPAAASIAARHVAIATGGRSGNRRFASRYGKLKRSVANPSSCIARVNPDMNGCSMPAPAPWATTIVPAASAGRVYTARDRRAVDVERDGRLVDHGLNTSKMPPMPSSADAARVDEVADRGGELDRAAGRVEGDGDLEGHVDGVGEHVEVSRGRGRRTRA